VAIGHTRLDQDNDTLKELLKTNKEKEIKVTGKQQKFACQLNPFINPLIFSLQQQNSKRSCCVDDSLRVVGRSGTPRCLNSFL
jgi:hypothetical protein